MSAGHHEHIDEASLVELALSAQAAPDSVRDNCPECARRLEEMRDFFGDLRSTLDEAGTVEPSAEERITRAVLMHTTREDLGWRGDLRLCGRFVGQRLSSSFVLRVVAASLLVHMAALPLLAWYGFRSAPASRIQWDFRPLAEAPFSEPVPEPERRIDVEADELPVLVEEELGKRELAIQNSLSWARVQLELGAPLAPQPETGWGTVDVLLAARSHWINQRDGSLVLPSRSSLAELERAVWCEYLLDRYVLEPERVPAELPAALAGLGAGGAVPARPTPVAVLMASTLARAEAYGLLQQEGSERLERLREELDGGSASRLIEHGAGFRKAGPLDPAWFAALERALADESGTGSAVEAWLDWARTR